jgi:hypothetical protein
LMSGPTPIFHRQSHQTNEFNCDLNSRFSLYLGLPILKTVVR